MFHCPQEGCTSSFTRRDNLCRHLKRHNNGEELQNVCNVCKRNFHTAQSYIAHLKKRHKKRTSFVQKSQFFGFVIEKQKSINCDTPADAEKENLQDIVKELSFYR